MQGMIPALMIAEEGGERTGCAGLRVSWLFCSEP